MLNVAFNTFEWGETGRLCAGVWGATRGRVQAVRGRVKGGGSTVSAAAAAAVASTSTSTSGSSSSSGSGSGSNSGSNSAAVTTTDMSHSHPASPQPFIDFIASALTTYLCVTRDMGLGVAVGVAVSRSGGLVRWVREKVGGVGK